jgi:hypothetical protein
MDTDNIKKVVECMAQSEVEIAALKAGLRKAIEVVDVVDRFAEIANDELIAAIDKATALLPELRKLVKEVNDAACIKQNCLAFEIRRDINDPYPHVMRPWCGAMKKFID